MKNNALTAREYPIAILPMEMDGDGVGFRLGYSDHPKSFRINVDESNEIIAIKFVYPADAHEDQVTASYGGGITVSRGKYSSRLFSIQISTETSVRSRDVLKRCISIVQKLESVLKAVAENSQRHGPKMNVSAVRSGLNIDVDEQPPAWLADAMMR